MIAYSNLNLKPKEFWDESSPHDFLMMCEGFNFRFKREYNLQLMQMKIMRWVGSLIYNTNVKQGHRKEPEKLFHLPDFEIEKKTQKLITREEMEALKKWIKK